MTTSSTPDTYVTVDEAAALLETTPTRILMLLRDKALIGEQQGDSWLVSRESIACCKTHGKDMKKEQGCKTYCSSGGCGCGR